MTTEEKHNQFPYSNDVVHGIPPVNDPMAPPLPYAGPNTVPAATTVTGTATPPSYAPPAILGATVAPPITYASLPQHSGNAVTPATVTVAPPCFASPTVPGTTVVPPTTYAPPPSYAPPTVPGTTAIPSTTYAPPPTNPGLVVAPEAKPAAPPSYDPPTSVGNGVPLMTTTKAESGTAIGNVINIDNVASTIPVVVVNDRLPYCGCGIGWFLFILGFIAGAIPWYVGGVLLCCGKRDKREEPGLIACMVMTGLSLILFITLIAV